jgi:RimJ/RimL family protein N-acetyltransferase
VRVEVDGVALELKLHDDDFVFTPVTPNDYGFLFQIATSEANSPRWRYHGEVPGYEAFVQHLYAGVLAQFVVRQPSGEPIGQVMAYAANLKNGHAAVGVVMADKAQRRGVGLRVLELFIGYLFDTWPFHGLYAEVPEFVFQPIADGSRTLTDRFPFEEVGRRPRYHYHKGRYWDDFILYLSRTNWEAR